MFSSLNLSVQRNDVSCVTKAMSCQPKTADLLYAKLTAAKRDLSTAETHAATASALAKATTSRCATETAQVLSELQQTKERLRAVTVKLDEQPDRATLLRVHALEERAHTSQRSLADLPDNSAERDTYSERAKHHRAVALHARHCATRGQTERPCHMHLGRDEARNTQLGSLLVTYPQVAMAASASHAESGAKVNRFISAVSRDISVGLQEASHTYETCTTSACATKL